MGKSRATGKIKTVEQFRVPESAERAFCGFGDYLGMPLLGLIIGHGSNFL
jgi:hypothetical protein